MNNDQEARLVGEHRDQRLQEMTANPYGHGFELVGFAVGLSNGKLLQEWRVLKPKAGQVLTADPQLALVWPRDQKDGAQWMCRRLTAQGAELAEVWESPRERLLRWGDQMQLELPGSGRPASA